MRAIRNVTFSLLLLRWGEIVSLWIWAFHATYKFYRQLKVPDEMDKFDLNLMQSEGKCE